MFEVDADEQRSFVSESSTEATAIVGEGIGSDKGMGGACS